MAVLLRPSKPPSPKAAAREPSWPQEGAGACGPSGLTATAAVLLQALLLCTRSTPVLCDRPRLSEAGRAASRAPRWVRCRLAPRPLLR